MTSPYGRALLICDGARKAVAVARALPEVRGHLERRAIEHEVRLTRGPGDATALARRGLEEGARFLVAVGGDGTVNEVINGMLADDRAVAPEAVMGVVALGRGCDFVRTFGIPALPGHAVAHLDGAESFPIDVGKVTFTRAGERATRYFANIAQAGLGARVASLAARLPRALGPMLYPVAFWAEVLRHGAADAVVDLVDRTYEGPINSLIVANGQFFGGGMRIAPKAVPTDGLLDVLIERARKLEAIAVMPKVFKGEHLPHPDIRLAKRVEVSIESSPPLLVEADGVVLGHTPATFAVLPDALRLKV